MQSPYFFCGTPTPALKKQDFRLQLQNVMCSMQIVYFMMNGENLILIRCTTDGAASIALDLNDIHMTDTIISMYSQGVRLYPESESPSNGRLRRHTPGWEWFL